MLLLQIKSHQYYLLSLMYDRILLFQCMLKNYFEINYHHFLIIYEFELENQHENLLNYSIYYYFLYYYCYLSFYNFFIYIIIINNIIINNVKKL